MPQDTYNTIVRNRSDLPLSCRRGGVVLPMDNKTELVNCDTQKKKRLH